MFKKFAPFTLALLVAVGAPALTTAQENQPAPDATAQAQKSAQQQKKNQKQANQRQKDDQQRDQDRQAENQRTLEVYELEYRKPQDVKQLVVFLANPTSVPSAASKRAKLGYPPEYPPNYPPNYENASAGKQADDVPVRISSDDDRDTLYVRGTDQQLRIVKQLIDAFDVDAGKLQNESIAGCRLFPVERDRAQHVDRILSELELYHEKVNWKDGRMILVFRDDTKQDKARVKEAERVIGKMTESRSQDKQQDGEKSSSEGNDSDGDTEQNRQAKADDKPAA